MARSIRFPIDLWKAIDEDAKRCKRSSVKQMEAVLSAYYGLEDVDLNRQKLEMIGEIKPKSSRKLPMMEIDVSDKKKKSD